MKKSAPTVEAPPCRCGNPSTQWLDDCAICEQCVQEGIKMTGEIIHVEPSLSDPMALIREAVKEKLSPDHLKTLFDLQRQWTRDEAAARYGEALAAFQAECPPVVKMRKVKNKDGSPRYAFAGFEDVMTVAGPLLTKNKIAVSITGPTNPDLMDLTVRVRVGIHVEEYPYVVKLPDLARLGSDTHCNECQASGIAHSYHKRYAVCAALGIKVIGEDTDARMNPPALTDAQTKEINTLADQCRDAGDPVKWDKLYAVYEMDPEAGLNDATQEQGTKIIATLKQKLHQAKGAKK